MYIFTTSEHTTLQSVLSAPVAVISPVPVGASSLLQVEEMEELGGALFLRSKVGVQRCPSTLSNHAQGIRKQDKGFLAACSGFCTSLSQTTCLFLFNAFCFCVLDSAVEGVSSSSSTKDVGSASPLTDRKKYRRKKSTNQKGDATLGQADGAVKTQTLHYIIITAISLIYLSKINLCQFDTIFKLHCAYCFNVNA